MPIPRVFDSNVDPDIMRNPVGLGYILMEKLPGRPLRWSLLFAEQRKKVISQLADVYIELQTVSFDSSQGQIESGRLHGNP